MMYVLQVKAGMDLQVAQNLRRKGWFVRCPQRTMFLRKNGTWTEKTEPVFAGYLFLEYPHNHGIQSAQYYELCKEEGVIGFLKCGTTPAELPACEEAYVQWLWNHGHPIEASKVYKTAHGDIMVLSGILRQHTDKILRMNLRQRRAVILLPMFGKEYRITLPVIGV